MLSVCMCTRWAILRGVALDVVWVAELEVLRRDAGYRSLLSCQDPRAMSRPQATRFD